MKKKIMLLLSVMLTALVLFLLCDHRNITLEIILRWEPPSPVIAAAVILLGYFIKGILVFVPITVLQIVAGHFFSGVAAITINLIGLAAVMIVPYWIGHHSGKAKIAQLMQKYPKVAALISMQQDNEIAVCFILRACAVPPADIVTMYLGASGISFRTNVIGGVLGCLPSMVLTTILGANIQNPASPAFWLSIALNAAWIALSALSYWIYRRYALPKEGENRAET